MINPEPAYSMSYPATHEADLLTIARAIRDGATSAVAVTERCLERIARIDPVLGAFVAVDAGRALDEAARLDAEQRGGHVRGPLHGVPLAYKDLFDIPGFPNSCGTAAPDYWRAREECTVSRRLADAGAVTLGKLRMTELAMGTFGVNVVQGTPRNPWSLDRIPGGSSSGCAVAVAAGLVAGALGTDTGGSIRIPAACCGVVGLKPTFGRVSRAGVMPLSASLDHVGPMARTVADVALLLSVIAGLDPADPASSREPVPDVVANGGADVTGLVVGLPDNGYFGGLAPPVHAAIEDAARVLAARGATIRRLTVPDPRPLMDATAIVVRAESAAAHRARLGQQDTLQPLVRDRLRAGIAIPAVEYLDARDRCVELSARFIAEVFGTVDALLLPIIPEPAPALGDVTTGSADDVNARMARFARFARFVNGLGTPALAVPCGFSADGLPLAFQLLARPFADAVVLRLGAAYEAQTSWARRRPACSVTPDGRAAAS